MTIAVGIGLPQAGFLAADTRLNLSFTTGDQRWHDAGEIRFTYPDGSEILVGERYRKIAPIGGGWVAGAGSFPLLHAQLRALEDAEPTTLQEIQGIVEQVYGDQRRNIEEHFPDDTDLDRSALVTLTNTEGEFVARCLIGEEGYRERGANDFYIIFPPDLSPGREQSLREGFVREFSGPSDLLGVYSCVRQIARLIGDVAEESRTVAARVEIGLMVRDHRGRVLSGHLSRPTNDVIEASDHELSEMIREL